MADMADLIGIHPNGDGVNCVRIGDYLLTPHEALQHAFDIIQHATTAAYANGRDAT